MIPFTRMLKYGHELQTGSVRSLDLSADGCMYLVDSFGDMFAYGPNMYGMRGTGSTGGSVYPFGWVKILGGVQRAFTNGSRSLVALMEDGRVMVSGTNNRYAFGGDYGANLYSFTDVSSTMPVPNDQIKSFKPFYTGSVILTTDNRLFWSGYNSYGLNGSGLNNNVLQSYTQVDPSSVIGVGAIIKDVHVYGFSASGYDVSVLELLDGKIYGAGSNAYKVITGATTTSYLTYTLMTSFPVTHISMGDRMCTFQRAVTNASNVTNIYTYYSGTNGPVGQYILNQYLAPGPTTSGKSGTATASYTWFIYISADGQRMYGGGAAGSNPISPSTAQTTPSSTIWHSIPSTVSPYDYKFYSSSKELLLYYPGTGVAGSAKLYALGTLVNQATSVGVSYIEIKLPVSAGGTA